MTLLFDTSVLIGLQRRDDKLIAKLEDLSKTYPLAPFITFLNLFEFLLGLKLKPPRNAKQAQAFVSRFDILNTTEKTSELLTDLKFKYDRKGLALSLADLIIASLAIENDMVLVTKDKDFEKIEELKKVVI